MKSTVIILLLLISTHLFAQKSFEFGIRVSPQISSLINENDKNSADLSSEYPIFPSFGVAFGYNFTNHLGVEVDVIFSREGQIYTGTTANDPNAYSSLVALQTELVDEKLSNPYQARAELNFIKFPIMLKLMDDNSKKLFYTAMVGLQLNKLKDAAQEVNGEDHTYLKLGIEPTDLYKQITIDAVLALGVGFNLTSHFLLTAQARFDYGLQDVENKDLTYTYKDKSYRFFSPSRSGNHNATVGLALGVNYRIFSDETETEEVE